MSNVAEALKQEIIRLARKEVNAVVVKLKADCIKLKKVQAQQKAAILILEKSNRALVAGMAKQGPVVENSESGDKTVSFTAKKIKALRKRLHITQKELAALAGVSVMSVSSWERKPGNFGFRGATNSKLVELAGMTRADLSLRREEGLPAEPAATKPSGKKSTTAKKSAPKKAAANVARKAAKRR